MLVLRRRAQEAIIFEGGLTLTLAEVADHRAWIAFRAPSIPVPVVVTSTVTSITTACIGVRSPTAVRYERGTTHVSVAAWSAGVPPGSGRADDPVDPSAVLLVNASVGERLVTDGITLAVGAIEQARVVLEATVAGIEATIGVSVFAVSGAEVKIGIAAPDDMRVYREEVWLAMRSANEAAAGWSTDDLASLAHRPAGVSAPPAAGTPRS